MALHFMNQQAPNKGLKLSSAAALGALAADMERPLSSLALRVVAVFVSVRVSVVVVVYVFPPWGPKTTDEAGRFDDESL